MSSYAAGLREAVNSWAAAYLQFETGRHREGYRSYAFVEDDDDKSFYQLALTQFDAICYLGCGGKSGVLALFNKLAEEGKANGQLFFVDRDTERQPFVHAQEVLRTTGYSWESHVCGAAFVGWFLQRRAEPNLSPNDVDRVVQGWNATLQAFKPVLDRHTALCRTAAALQTSLGMSRVVFTSDAEQADLGLKPGPKAFLWQRGKVDLAIKQGASEEDLVRREMRYQEEEVLFSARGKALFMLLRTFVVATLNALERRSRGEMNSAKVWIEAMPWTESSLDYVRDYARRRLEPV